MRILHAIRTLDPAWGGPVEGARNITLQAIARGHEPEIVCLDSPASPWLHSWVPKIHLIGPAFRQYGFSPQLDVWLKTNLARFDAVIVHSIWMYFSYAVWKATRGTNVPYYLFIHGALDPWFRGRYPLKQIKKSIYWKLIESNVLRDAERVLFTTDEEMLLADNAFVPYQCRAQVTGYGIEKPPVRHDLTKETQRDSMTLLHPSLKNRNFILFLGRLHEKKGIDLLLKAFAAMKPHLPNSALVIAGSGKGETTEFEDSLKKLTSSLHLLEDVVWTGPLYGAAKWQAMQAADAYILPSHQENFGISVVESLACGTPVLISDKVNTWREILSAKAGLVAPDDLTGTISLLRDWVTLSAAAKSEMQLNAVACFNEKFDISNTSHKLFHLLDSRATAPKLAEQSA